MKGVWWYLSRKRDSKDDDDGGQEDLERWYGTEGWSDPFLFQCIIAHSSKQSPLTQRPTRNSFPPYLATRPLSLLISAVPVGKTTRLLWVRERKREREGWSKFRHWKFRTQKKSIFPSLLEKFLSTAIYDTWWRYYVWSTHSQREATLYTVRAAKVIQVLLC